MGNSSISAVADKAAGGIAVTTEAPALFPAAADVSTTDDPAGFPTATPVPDVGTIFTVKPNLASGEFLQAATPSTIATATLDVDEAWVFEIDTNDAADEIHVILKVRRV